MVGHTHQDFLTSDLTDGTEDISLHAVDLSQIKDISCERELFDVPSRYVRKTQLSHLDEHLDRLSDWEDFVRPLTGLDCLYLVNDRSISNPIMCEYANSLDRRYIAMFKKYGILAVIATPVQSLDASS